MHISAKCSVAVRRLLFVAEHGESSKITSELLDASYQKVTSDSAKRQKKDTSKTRPSF